MQKILIESEVYFMKVFLNSFSNIWTNLKKMFYLLSKQWIVFILLLTTLFFLFKIFSHAHWEEHGLLIKHLIRLALSLCMLIGYLTYKMYKSNK